MNEEELKKKIKVLENKEKTCFNDNALLWGYINERKILEAKLEGFQKGKLEQKKEELEFLDDCFRVYRGEKYIQSDSISKLIERIKQLQKEIGGMK